MLKIYIYDNDQNLIREETVKNKNQFVSKRQKEIFEEFPNPEQITLIVNEENGTPFCSLVKKENYIHKNKVRWSYEKDGHTIWVFDPHLLPKDHKEYVPF